jgi:hypothetical protein
MDLAGGLEALQVLHKVPQELGSAAGGRANVEVHFRLCEAHHAVELTARHLHQRTAW